MALLTKDNRYIKIDINGNFTIYESEKNRLGVKKAPSFSKVVAVLNDLNKELEANVEYKYYDHENWIVESDAVNSELARYSTAYFNHIKINAADFPILKAKIKGFANSVPLILASGQINVKGNTIEEVYEYVKQIKFFGETEDI